LESREQLRLNTLLSFEKEAKKLGFSKIAGIDEAGRGPLAGPVVACACLIPEGVLFAGVDDSKQLTPKKREHLFEEITSHKAVKYGFGVIDAKTIDEVNIFQATILAMLQAVASLAEEPDYLLVDGLKLPHKTIASQKIIRGDALSHSIAAASILAKVFRDQEMVKYDALWPEYGFKQHKGYGTKMHLDALKVHGPSPIHRLSFAPCREL